MVCILLWSSAVRIHDSQAYRKMDVTRERISRILELREILLSIQTGFSFVNAAVACAILGSISGLKPSSVITEPRYLQPFLANIKKVLGSFKRVLNVCTGTRSVRWSVRSVLASRKEKNYCPYQTDHCLRRHEVSLTSSKTSILTSKIDSL